MSVIGDDINNWCEGHTVRYEDVDGREIRVTRKLETLIVSSGRKGVVLRLDPDLAWQLHADLGYFVEDTEMLR